MQQKKELIRRWLRESWLIVYAKPCRRPGKSRREAMKSFSFQDSIAFLPRRRAWAV
jgi:hypothetical protein